MTSDSPVIQAESPDAICRRPISSVSREIEKLDVRNSQDIGICCLVGRGSGGLNYLNDFSWIRYEADVARLNLPRLSAVSLRHESFQIGVDGIILRRDNIP